MIHNLISHDNINLSLCIKLNKLLIFITIKEKVESFENGGDGSYKMATCCGESGDGEFNV